MTARLILLLGLAGAVGLFARAPPPPPKHGPPLLLPRPTLLRVLGRSHLHLVTDFYWLKAINLAGDVVTKEEDGRALLQYGELITDLDPRFAPGYWMPGLNAPVPGPNREDPWPNAREAVALTRKGITQLPLNNQLTIVLAHTLMYDLHDYPGAAAALQARAQLPGALPHFAPLATRLLAASGRFDASRDFARIMIESAPDDATRELFEQRLKLIDLEEILSAVDAAAQKFEAERGQRALTVEELVVAGYLPSMPEDPFGGLILLRDNKSYSTVSKRLEVYQ